MHVKIIKSKDVKLPRYQTVGSSGMDLHAYISDPIWIYKNTVEAIPTGLYMEIPQGYEGQIRSRSGLALKGISVANSPGTIDSDYRGEVKVLLKNSLPAYRIKPGDRIAQIVFAEVSKVIWDEVEELNGTDRDKGGMGSTGS